MENYLNIIASNCPLGWAEFKSFSEQAFKDFFTDKKLSLEELPFPFLTGLFLYYFNNQQIDFTLGDTDEQIIKDEILETFRNYEQVISHFS